MKKYIFLIVIFFYNCDLLENRPDQVLARVNDKFIYESDLKKALPDGLSNEDSILFAKNFINNWAKKNLLFEKALINLEDSKQNELNKLIESYKNDLFSFTYQEKIIKFSMDTIISDSAIIKYYDINKSNFKLNQEIVKARYLKINSENYNLKDVTKRFRSLKSNEDRKSVV